LRLASRTAAIWLVVAMVAACGSVNPSPSGSPSRAAAPTPVASSPPGPTTAPGASASPAAAASASALADPTLLDIVPATAAGLALTYDPDTTAIVAADPAVARDASGIAVGLAMPAGLASPEELVIVNAVRLRDPSAGDDWFRNWRDTYDTAACEQAGGVQGHAESPIQGRTVYIGSCTNGVFTYHVRLDDGAVVVSLTSIGPSRLGERLVRQLPPA
jgi:hypothetical protein